MSTSGEDGAAKGEACAGGADADLRGHTVEITKRFKGLDLIDKVPEELWTEVHNIVQKAVIKSSPRKRNKKGKIVV